MAEIVAEMEIAGGLDTGEDERLEGHRFGPEDKFVREK